MFPECIIASWDECILLLDTENIEERVQLLISVNFEFVACFPIEFQALVGYFLVFKALLLCIFMSVSPVKSLL